MLVYPTSRALVEEYFTEDGHMEWDRSHTFYDGDKPFTVTAAEALKNIRRKGYWAYVSNKSQFHIWFRRNVSDENLIALLAHEYGHLMRPYHLPCSGPQEEAKAKRYEMTARTAANLAKVLRRGAA